MLFEPVFRFVDDEASFPCLIPLVLRWGFPLFYHDCFMSPLGRTMMHHRRVYIARAESKWMDKELPVCGSVWLRIHVLGYLPGMEFCLTSTPRKWKSRSPCFWVALLS
ncbi:hypothetical protein Nepgr_026654 [Nepenthes gracilis]|uniref:Uncharacterized protein n=1 Tax=Nepenthes gracilis TaxID=150966 RepID=A0AAD3Y2Q3_NEPGR|nr:hypothetical protein Nepgr_026654 [Nepenthes gracilis]